MLIAAGSYHLAPKLISLVARWWALHVSSCPVMLVLTKKMPQLMPYSFGRSAFDYGDDCLDACSDPWRRRPSFGERWLGSRSETDFPGHCHRARRFAVVGMVKRWSLLCRLSQRDCCNCRPGGCDGTFETTVVGTPQVTRFCATTIGPGTKKNYIFFMRIYCEYHG